MILAVALLVIGLVLILAEILVPSLGLLSVIAIASLAGSVVTAFLQSVTTGVWFVIACAALIPGTLVLGMKLLPRSPLGKKMISGGLSFESTRATDARDLSLLGQRGTVEAVLRPAGMARIAGRRVDVVSRGERIEVGTAVEVVEVRGNRVVVVPSKPQAAAPSSPSDEPSENVSQQNPTP